MPWAAAAVATQISDVLAQNYYEPEGALPEVGYQGPDRDGNYVVWVGSPGSPLRIAVVVVPVEFDDGEPSVHVTLGE